MPFLVAVAAFTMFVGLRAFGIDKTSHPKAVVGDRVVISAPMQLLLAGGDRFLAANFETIRLSSTGNAEIVANTDDAVFRIRAHRVVAQLNACHEDNYYVGNALLSWGGAPEEGSDILRRSMECRVWDEFVPFFYGFNELFFYHNLTAAQHAFEIAAKRSEVNSAVYRRLAIMVAADEMKNEYLALDYLRRQRDAATDQRLREMLGKRVERLEGLLMLREAQHRYESRFSKLLSDPAELISSGVITDFPVDPLRLGYIFESGRFNLRKLKIDGIEEVQ